MTYDYIDKQMSMLSTLNILSHTLICVSMPYRGDPGARPILPLEQVRGRLAAMKVSKSSIAFVNMFYELLIE